MAQTFVEKLLSRKAGLTKVVPGQIVEVAPDTALSHDNAAAIQSVFKEMCGTRVFDPSRIMIVIDHGAPPPTTKHAENHRAIRQFVKDQGIKSFYDIGRGICHQVIVEEGLALPGELVLGSDSHTTHAGVMGALGVGIGRSEMASVWALGRIWMRVPESVKIVVQGKFAPGVGAKDLALKVIGDHGADGGLYQSIEWHGATIEDMPLSQRAVLTNMAAEFGAKNSFIPPDEKVIDYLLPRAKRHFEPIYSDPDSHYVRVLEYDASEIVPLVACPHTVDNVATVDEVAGTKIDEAFLGTCTNGRLEDLETAASILKGRRVAPGTRMLVIPASLQVYREALQEGYIDIFTQAGALVLSPGCGPCMGNHMGVPAPGEVVISTANRNFRGRMGTRESQVFLANPGVVAASAVAGEITRPEGLLEVNL